MVTCREPGGTVLGEGLRGALFGLAEPPAPLAELLVFAAARAQLVHEVIRPALVLGSLVLCDRFSDSTIAYQSFGRGLERDMVEAVAAIAAGGLVPDLTVLLDVPPEVGLARDERGGDYIERADLEFHTRVHEGYHTLVADEPDRWLVLDGRRPASELSDAIWARLAPWFARS